MKKAFKLFQGPAALIKCKVSHSDKSTCSTTTLGQFGPGISAEAVPAICKAMVGGLVPRNAGAETLAKLGTRGVSALIRLLETSHGGSRSTRTRSRIAAASGLGRVLDGATSGLFSQKKTYQTLNKTARLRILCIHSSTASSAIT